MPTSNHIQTPSKVNVDNEIKSKRYSFHPGFEVEKVKLHLPAPRANFTLLADCAIENVTRNRASTMTDSSTKMSTASLAYLGRKNKKSCRYLTTTTKKNSQTHTHAITIKHKRHQRVIRSRCCVQNRARSNVKCHSFCSRRGEPYCPVVYVWVCVCVRGGTSS